MGGVAGALLLLLIGWSGWQAWLVVREALGGSRYVQWSAVPVVWWGEVGLAACSVLLAVAAAVFAVRRLGTATAGSAPTFGGIGLGFLALGVLGVAVGWLGLQAPTTPGYDVLSRGEPMSIIGGGVALALGTLVLILAAVADALGTPRRDDVGDAPRSRSWLAPDAPTWELVRTGLLPGALPGDRVIVAVEGDSVIVAVVTGDSASRRRLATYPAQVRLEPADDGTHRLAYGSAEIAILRPVDADPAALAADLDAATT
ncbi:MAG: hypothetical protein AB1627_05440 [Chloroflexota bacterium]